MDMSTAIKGDNVKLSADKKSVILIDQTKLSK